MREVTDIRQCFSCSVVEGSKICRETLVDFRGYSICGWCVSRWKRREALVGREISFDSFKTGILNKGE